MVLCLAFIISCSTLLLQVSALSDEEEWIKFKESYGKTYTSREEGFRFKTFQRNLRKIEENFALFNKKQTSYTLGINKFADVPAEEFRNFLKASHNYGLNNKKVSKVELKNGDCITKTDPIPDTFDWRDRGAVTPVIDGETYYNGNSWAFAVGGALETQVFLSTKYLIPLSNQQLIDCVNVSNSKNYYWSGKLDFVYDYLFKQGILTEDEYPYSEYKENCRDIHNIGILIAVLVNMDDECDIKQAVALSGTVTAVIDASGLLSYRGGIVDGSLCSNYEEDLNHSVLIVGYGKDEDFGEYWIVKNSWGTDWGENGYFRLARLRNNTCGVGVTPSYPIVL